MRALDRVQEQRVELHVRAWAASARMRTLQPDQKTSDLVELERQRSLEAGQHEVNRREGRWDGKRLEIGGSGEKLAFNAYIHKIYLILQGIILYTNFFDSEPFVTHRGVIKRIS